MYVVINKYHLVVNNSVRIRNVLVEKSVDTLVFSVVFERAANSSQRRCISSVLILLVLAAAFNTISALSCFPTAKSHLGDSGISLKINLF